MAPPSTTLNPAGTPSLAECASRFQCAVPSTCQMPFKSGLPSGVRGPLYLAAAWAPGARGGVAPRCGVVADGPAPRCGVVADGAAPRCACATEAAVPASKTAK